MADWGPWFGDRQESYNYAAVTPGATTHTKGSWSELPGDALERAESLSLYFPLLGTSSTRRSFLIDVSIGDSYVPLISNLLVTPSHVGDGLVACRECSQRITFPVAIPPGHKLYARAQTNVSSHGAVYLTYTKMRSGLPTFGVVDTYGANTGATRGVELRQQDNVEGGWDSNYYELTPSSQRIKAFFLAVGHGQADWSSYSNQWYAVRIGVGPAGSEVELMTISEAGGASSNTQVPTQLFLGPYYVDLPEGTRIAAKASKQYASTLQRTIDVVMYGLR